MSGDGWAESAVRDRLIAHAGAYALIGKRIRAGRMPKGQTLPAVVIHFQSSVPDMCHTGPSGLVDVKLQLNVWGRDYKDAKQAAKQVKFALNGQTFTKTDFTVYVAIVKDTTELDFEEEVMDHCFALDVLLKAREPTT